MRREQKTILFAEDSLSVRLMTKSLLEENGYKVLEAEDGQIAIDIYQRERNNIDAIISDLQMPNVDGFELAQFNYENDLFPFIVCTSIREAKTAIKFLEWGVQDYIEKPYQKEEFITVVKNAINRNSGEHSHEEIYTGNVDSITIPSKQSELANACNWIEKKVMSFFDEHECLRFVNFFNEFLVNAHEHGNMKINEEEKMRLIIDGTFEKVLEELENKISANIKVAISVLETQLAVSVSDEGKGFDYVKYVKMSDEDLMDKLTWPNGRGIFMSAQYFNSTFYREKGSTVVLIKKFK